MCLSATDEAPQLSGLVLALNPFPLTMPTTSLIMSLVGPSEPTSICISKSYLAAEIASRSLGTILKAKSKEICPAEGYCVGVVFKAFIHGLECALVVPQVADYPENLLEIVAPENLRVSLRLRDGDSVAVTVCV